MRLRRDFLLGAIGLLLTFALTSGCSFNPRLVTLIYEGDEGTVFLKEFHDSTPRADHPATLTSQLVRRILLGVRVHERKTMIESTPDRRRRSDARFHLFRSELSHSAPRVRLQSGDTPGGHSFSSEGRCGWKTI